MEPTTKRAFYLGRYNCIERLGDGRLGETWRAKVYGVAGFEKQFAVKRLHESHTLDEGRAQALVAAANAYAALDHERIARVHEVNVQGAQYFVASDLMRGVELGKLLEWVAARGEALPTDAALLIALDCADALGYAHARTDLFPDGVLHLGLTPRSIVVTHEGEVRLTDVGLVAPLVRASWADGADAVAWAGYMAPEALRAQPRDARADVFSLGAILYEMLSGRAPFSGADGAAIRQAMEAGGLPAATSDARLLSLLAQSLQATAEFRLPSMAAFREQLVPVLASRANRARADLGALVRRIARPERKTGAFPVVAMPAMPPPPPASPPPKNWAPPPRGPQLASPSRNTLAGVGHDDVLPVEMAELPGHPTLPQMDTVSDDEVTRPIELAELETAKITRATAAELAPSSEQTTSKVEKVDVDAAWTAAAGGELATDAAAFAAAMAASATTDVTAAPGSSDDDAPTNVAFTPSPEPKTSSVAEPLAADPRRFPSLMKEDELQRTETDGRTETLSSMTPVAAPPPPPTAQLLTTTPAHVNGHKRPQAFVPPPLELPPVPSDRPWALIITLLLIVGSAVAGGVYYFFLRADAPETPVVQKPAEPVVEQKPAEQKPAPEQKAAPVETPVAVEKPAEQKPVATPTPTGGNLAIASTPPGATIYVDGEARGVTPASLEAAPGAHRVVVMLEGHKLKREQVKVAGAHTQINFTLEAVTGLTGSAGLKVRCAKTHGELRILVDGEDTGRACPNEARIAVTPGARKIGLYSPRTDQTVEVEKDVPADGDHSLRVYLKY